MSVSGLVTPAILAVALTLVFLRQAMSRSPGKSGEVLALPEPSEGDLFFDIEGARYYSEDGREFGLQYLFGIVDTAEPDETAHPRYTQLSSSIAIPRSARSRS